MKHMLTMLLASFFLMGCQGQEKKEQELEEKNEVVEQPKGSWKVNRDFDEEGNLIRYDSIYSWSSTENMGDLMQMDRDSIFQSFRSQFSRNFSGFEDFTGNGLFAQDSLFVKRFFADDFFESKFGQDFMDLDKMHQEMEAMQKRFLERYHAPKPKEDKQMEKI